jgi:hypothetical protein
MKTKGNFIQVHTSKYRLSPFFNSPGPKEKKSKINPPLLLGLTIDFCGGFFLEREKKRKKGKKNQGRILFRKGKKKKEREKKSMVSPMSPHLEPWTVQVLT